MVRQEAAGRSGCDPQRPSPQQDGTDRLQQWSNKCRNAPEGEPQSGGRADRQQSPKSVTQRHRGPHHHFTQAGRYTGLHHMALAARKGWTQSQVMDDQQGFPSPQPQFSETQDVYRPSLHQHIPSTAQLVAVQLNSKGHVDNAAVVARDTEELEWLSPDLLVRLSAMVLRNAGLPPRKGVTALDSACSVPVRLGAKPPAPRLGPALLFTQTHQDGLWISRGSLPFDPRSRQLATS